MLKMKRAQRDEYEAMQRQENRERALSRLRSLSYAAMAALTDGTAYEPSRHRPVDIRRRPKRKAKR